MSEDFTIYKVPGRCAGHPTVGPTRITVHDIIGYLKLYGSAEAVLADFTHWTQQHIDAALAYYAENRDEIDDIRWQQARDYWEGLSRQQQREIAALKTENAALREACKLALPELRCLYQQATRKRPEEATGSVKAALDALEGTVPITESWDKRQRTLIDMAFERGRRVGRGEVQEPPSDHPQP